MRQFLLIAGAAALAGLASPASAETTLRFAYTQSPSDSHHLAATRFKEQVEAATKGELKITLHPGGELGSDPALLEGVRLGTIDIVEAGNPFFTRFEPKLNVLDLPYLFEDYDHVYRVIDGPVGRRLLDGLDKHGMKGLAFWEIGFRSVTTKDRPIRTPDDLKGLRIRTTPNPAHVEAFKLLGAVPTPLPFTEVYLALETGTVDGQENPLGTIRAARFYEVQDHLTLSRHAYTVSIVAMNQGKWDALSPDQQKIILDAAAEAQKHQRELNREIDQTAMKTIREAGMQVVEEIDTEAFRKVVFDPVKATYVGEHGSEDVDEILAAAP